MTTLYVQFRCWKTDVVVSNLACNNYSGEERYNPFPRRWFTQRPHDTPYPFKSYTDAYSVASADGVVTVLRDNNIAEIVIWDTGEIVKRIYSEEMPEMLIIAYEVDLTRTPNEAIKVL